MKAYIVHVEADFRSNRMHAFARLEDGRSCVLVDTTWRPRILIRESQLDAVRQLAGVANACRLIPNTGLRGIDGETLTALESVDFSSWRRLVTQCEANACKVWESDRSFAQLWMRDRGLGIAVSVSGHARQGRMVDIVYPEPVLTDAGTGWDPCLTYLAFSLERDDKTQEIIAAAWCDEKGSGVLVSRASHDVDEEANATCGADLNGRGELRWVSDEKELLRAFFALVRQRDPDILTGWNLLDVDMAHLSERTTALGMRLDLGRATRPASYRSRNGGRSSSVNVPGRQMLDAMRLVRSGPNHFADLSFASVAQAMLGVDKAVLEVGTSIGRSCLNDAELCREILDVSGLLKLTIRRSILTGSFLDMAWTSIASFETLYARELRKKGIVEPHPSSMPLSGSPGGTIFEPTACLREAVLVFDYRSLYPSIISTFFIDPLGFRDAKEIPDELCVTAPNGARFVRGHGILPSFIAYCFAERIVAVDRGDKTGAYVLKILMNSLYGVLAADGCRYAHGDLAGAVTTFGTWCLETAREWFESRGLEVFYGDTDSIFLQSALTEANSHLEFSKLGEELAEEFNRYLSRSILERWQVESRIQLRFDKAYRRFLIPPTRMQNGIGKSVRGRSKGYAGLESRPQGEDVLDIKGMEAVRSDVTPLARRLQRELLTMVFTGRTAIIPEYLCDLKRDLLAGRLDNELVYHKKLRHRAQRPRRDMPTDDRATVRVASEKTGHRISYVWTVIGPYPVGSDCHKIDYRHYLASQILPIARGIGALAGFNPDDILCNGQMELFSPDRPDVSSS